MKSGPFISIVAISLGVDEKKVRFIARKLKEAGHLTSGARGVNAPDMTPKDLATITITLLATDTPSKAVSEFEFYSAMQVDHADHREGINPKVLGPDHTFLEFMSFLCDPSFTLPDDFEISFDKTKTITISQDERTARYHSRSEWEKLSSVFSEHSENEMGELSEEGQNRLHEFQSQSPAMVAGGIRTCRSITETPIKFLKLLVFDDE